MYEYELILTKGTPSEPLKLTEELEAAVPVQTTEKAVRVWTSRGGDTDPDAGFTEARVKYDAPAEFSQAEKDALQAILDAHAGITELDRKTKINPALQWKRGELANVDWSTVALTAGERKLILGVPLTYAEEDVIIAEWEAV